MSGFSSCHRTESLCVPSAIAKLASYGNFGIKAFSYYAPENQDAIIWNRSIKAWVTGDPADGKYLSLKGGTVDGDVTIKGEVNVEGNIHMKGGTIDGIPDPVKGDDVVSKEWVLAQVGAVQGVPAGLIAFWASDTTVPAGWFKLDGSTYRVQDNPGMDAVIRQMNGERSGTLPDWRGHFVHHTERRDNTYDYNGGKPGQKVAGTTANSTRSGGIGTSEIEHKHETEGMRVLKFSVNSLGREALRPIDVTSNANSSPEFSTTKHKHTHTLTNFDPITRPKSVAGYWIIKGG